MGGAMTIRYNRVLAYAFMVLGGWLLLLRSFNTSLVIGFVLLLLAALYLTRPSYFTIEKNQVVVSAMVGPVKRTFFFRTAEDVKVEGGRLFVRDGERWKRVPVYRWMSDAADWKAMESKLAAVTPGQTV